MEKKNVILLMLDGVRCKEFFGKVDKKLRKKFKIKQKTTFDKFWNSDLPNQGVIFGNKSKGSSMVVKGEPCSLPSYATIFKGSESKLNDNYKGRVSTETIAEKIKKELDLKKEDVATIASWDNINQAVQHKKGTIYTNCGPQKIKIYKDDPIIKHINNKQIDDEPSWAYGSRYDKYTWDHAIHYLKNVKPRFMFISLNDSDGSMHHGMYKEYIRSLNDYDKQIMELVELIDTMKEYKNKTTLVITTDHGRGETNNKDEWKDHSSKIPGSEDIWMYVRGPYIKKRGFMKHMYPIDTTIIYPIIEYSMGLTSKISKLRDLIYVIKKKYIMPIVNKYYIVDPEWERNIK